MRRLRASEVAPSFEEQEAARKAASAQATASTSGGAIGSLVGALLGLGATAVTGGAAAAGIPTAIGLGGSLGSTIGGFVGGQEADAAARRLEMLGAARAEKLAREEARRRAFAALINRSPE